MAHQHPNLSRMVPYFTRAGIASGNLDRSRNLEPAVCDHGLADCLDAPDHLPTGGYGQPGRRVAQREA